MNHLYASLNMVEVKPNVFVHQGQHLDVDKGYQGMTRLEPYGPLSNKRSEYVDVKKRHPPIGIIVYRKMLNYTGMPSTVNTVFIDRLNSESGE